MLLYTLVYVFSFFTGLNGQSVSGVTSTGQLYLCLTTGTFCPTSNGTTPGGTNIIDPRIVTPGATGTTCPTGTFPCFGQTLPCGTRYVTPNGTADGNTVFGEFPWQAFLRNTTNAFAGSGVLLSPFYVLTAAHKVYLNVQNPGAVTVLMGVWNPVNLQNVQSSTVRTITVHPSFVPATLRNDIAVLTLNQPIVLGIYSNINAVCLPTTGTSFTGQNCAVSGWGQTAFTTFDAPTNPQKKVTVGIVDYNTCRTSFSAATLLGTNVDTYLDQAGEICAGGQAMRDACSQDGGSPLVCPTATGTHNLAGLVIWGKNCGQTGVYGVYVNVPNYYQWILSIIQPAAG